MAGQVVLILNFLVTYELFSRYPFAYWQELLVFGSGAIMLLMNVFAYFLIRELTGNRAVLNIILVLLYGGVILSIIVGSGVLATTDPLYGKLSVLSILCSLVAFCMLLLFMLVDIFREKHDVSYRLWGCASIYLLFGSTFGLLYTLLELLLPSEFALEGTRDIFKFIPCFSLSFYTLSGIDSPFDQFSLLIKNITVVESIFSNLYIVLVVGRLLSK